MHEEVSILFTDIVGFTAMSQECIPYQVMQFLHALFLRFDDLCDMDDSLWKVETIGDAVSSKSYHFPQTEKRLQDPISDFIWSLSLSLSLGSSWSQAAWRGRKEGKLGKRGLRIIAEQMLFQGPGLSQTQH